MSLQVGGSMIVISGLNHKHGGRLVRFFSVHFVCFFQGSYLGFHILTLVHIPYVNIERHSYD